MWPAARHRRASRALANALSIALESVVRGAPRSAASSDEQPCAVAVSPRALELAARSAIAPRKHG